MPPLNYKFTALDGGPLAIFELPVKDTKYTIGVDGATGVGADWTAFNVISNRRPFEQVARYRAKVDTVVGPKAMVDLGHYYNNALLVIETRFPGNTYADAAAITYKYPRIYRKEEHLDSDPNVSDKFGIATTQADKWLLIRELTEELAADSIILNDYITINEILNYIYIEDKSKTGAVAGLNDDCLIALMLAVHGAILYPQKSRSKKKKTLTGEIAQHRAIMDKFMDGIRMGKKEEPVVV